MLFFKSRYQTYFRTNYIKVEISTVPTEWYHLVFNYIGSSNEDGVAIYHDGMVVGSNTQVSYNTNAGQGVVVLGRYFVHTLEQDFASVMVDELLFFNRKLTSTEVQILFEL